MKGSLGINSFTFHDFILFCIKNGISIDFNIDFVILYHLR